MTTPTSTDALPADEIVGPTLWQLTIGKSGRQVAVYEVHTHAALADKLAQLWRDGWGLFDLWALHPVRGWEDNGLMTWVHYELPVPDFTVHPARGELAAAPVLRPEGDLTP